MLLAGMVRGGRRERGAALTLLLAPAIASWLRSDRELDPVRYAGMALADDMAYGTGVIAGCVQHRTVRPLLPKLINRSRR
jgi:hypothetical protein